MIDYAELIPSKDVRAYMEKRGRVLTDFEKAALIYNHSEMSYSKKATQLKELMELTEDSNLKEEIQERLSYDERCLNKFYENDGTCIYELQVYDPENQESCEQGYYTTGEVAVTCGKKFHENFSVHKIVVLKEEKEPEDCRSDYIAAIYIDSQGKVRGYYSSEVEWSAKKSEIDCRRFENAFIKIPHPFRNGDFVKIKNNPSLEDEVCIVECFNLESDESTSKQHSASYDYEDASLRVSYIYGAARFGHDHVRIVDIEFATPNEVDPKYGLLYCAQNLVLGRGGLNDLQLLCDEYRSRRRFKSSDEE